MMKKSRDIKKQFSPYRLEADGLDITDGEGLDIHIEFNRTMVLNGRVVISNYRGNPKNLQVTPFMVRFRCSKCKSKLVLTESKNVYLCLGCRTSGTSSRR